MGLVRVEDLIDECIGMSAHLTVDSVIHSSNSPRIKLFIDSAQVCPMLLPATVERSAEPRNALSPAANGTLTNLGHLTQYTVTVVCGRQREEDNGQALYHTIVCSRWRSKFLKGHNEDELDRYRS